MAPGITSWAAYGHTPWHTGFKALLMMIDSTNNPFVFARHPEWEYASDVDRKMAVDTASACSIPKAGHIGIDFSSLDPIKALFWSAVINGFVAVPVMAAMMWVGSRRDQMGRFTVAPLTLTLGWATTAIMAAAAVAMLLF